MAGLSEPDLKKLEALKLEIAKEEPLKPTTWRRPTGFPQN